MENLLIWIVLSLLVVLSNIQQSLSSIPYLPRFYTPNQYNYDGQLCSDLRPTVKQSCPTFGININTNKDGSSFVSMSQAEIEEQCVQLNFARCFDGEYLFPDGVCRSCPSGYEVKGDGTGDLYCENEDNIIRYKNPFNCEDSIRYVRKIQNSYRPCKWQSGYETVDIEHYYKGEDMDQVVTMGNCYANLIGSNDVERHIAEMHNHVINSDLITHDSGFLQCPIDNPPYNFLNIGFVLVYAVFIFGAVANIFYSVYKKASEKSLLSEKSAGGNNLTREGTSMFDAMQDGSKYEVDEIHRIKQAGIKTSWAGTIAWLSFWLMAWTFHIVFFFLVIDVYGFWYKTLCPAEVNEFCDNSENIYMWRTGFSCASGCLFSTRNTVANAPFWPYETNTAGMTQIYAFLCANFFICGIWWIFVVLFYKQVYFFYFLRCHLGNATHVECSKDKEPDIRIEGKDSKLSLLFKSIENFMSKYFKSQKDIDICAVLRGNAGEKYFIFRCIKYVYDNDDAEFKVKEITVGKTKADLYTKSLAGLTSREAYERLMTVGENKINYSVDPLSLSIWNELFNLFYLYQFIFLWVWYFNFYWVPAIGLTAVVAFAAITGIVVKRSSQRALVELSDQHTDVIVKRDGKWVSLSSHFLAPGDLIKLNTGDLIVSDNVLTSGRVVMNESSLTGEPAPVPKVSLSNTNQPFGHSTEDMKYTLLSGTKVESVSHGPEGYTTALVLSTGINTRQGGLLLSMLFPPRLRFKFDDDFATVFMILFAFGLIFMLIVGYLMFWVAMAIYYGIFTLSHALNPLITAMFTTAQARCAADLKKRRIECIEISRSFVAAKVKIFCFDKTGTLTKQGMEYFGYSEIDRQENIKFQQGTKSMPKVLRYLMGSCHELDNLTKEDGKVELVGNEVDVAMFENSNFKIIKHEKETTLIKDSEDQSELKILKRFEFSRDTMMMSVVVQDMSTNKTYLFTKGSFENVHANSNPNSLVPNLAEFNTRYAMQGHYVLGIAFKELADGFDYTEIDRSEIERDFTFLGFFHFKNHLKEDTKDVIEHLKQGNINCSMITGDNIYTACSIAEECGIASGKLVVCDFNSSNRLSWFDFNTQKEISFDEAMELFKSGAAEQAVTYKSFDFLRKNKSTILQQYSKNSDSYESELDAMRYLLKYTVVFARMKPDHKVKAVRMQMYLGITGMCGDGANDAAALRLAHCGIAIATGGSNATIVAPFSSPSHSLSVVVDIIRYGRGTLASAFSIYKRMIVAGQTTIILKLFLYHFSLQISEVSWIMLDLVFNIGLSLTMLSSKPAKRLASTRPTSSLLSTETFASVGCQIVVIFLTFWFAFQLIFNAEFFACNNFDTSLADLNFWWTMGDNYEAALCSFLALFLVAFQGFIFNLGYKYRSWWFKNYYLLITVVICLAYTILILILDPNPISCFTRVNCGDQSLIDAWNDLDIIETAQPVVFAPPGCPCTEQLIVVDTCDQPYIDCQAEHFNSSVHNNIFPRYFRYEVLGLAFAYFVASIFMEWFVIYGPLRRYLSERKRRAKKAIN